MLRSPFHCRTPMLIYYSTEDAPINPSVVHFTRGCESTAKGSNLESCLIRKPWGERAESHPKHWSRSTHPPSFTRYPLTIHHQSITSFTTASHRVRKSFLGRVSMRILSVMNCFPISTTPQPTPYSKLQSLDTSNHFGIVALADETQFPRQMTPPLLPPPLIMTII